MQQITVHKGRTVTVPVSLFFDVSADTITSDIRTGRSESTPLIAQWIVTNKTDGSDGEIILRLDDSVTANITQYIGYMDLKRITDGEPVVVFEDPLQVVFKDVVTD